MVWWASSNNKCVCCCWDESIDSQQMQAHQYSTTPLSYTFCSVLIFNSTLHLPSSSAPHNLCTVHTGCFPGKWKQRSRQASEVDSIGQRSGLYCMVTHTFIHEEWLVCVAGVITCTLHTSQLPVNHRKPQMNKYLCVCEWERDRKRERESQSLMVISGSGQQRD